MIKLFYPLLAMSLFTQCQQDEPHTTSTNTSAKREAGDKKFGQEVLLQQYGQATLVGKEIPRRLNVSMKSIEDSRCPTDVNCVTAGNATVVLRASSSHGANENIELCIGDCGSGSFRETDQVNAEVGDITYKFTLKGVKPHPGQEQEGQVQTAQLVVEKI